MSTDFTTDVIEKIGYYVYRLIDPRNGNTFYIGKGKGNRIFQHVKGAIDYYDGADGIQDSDPNKLRTIMKIHQDGLEVIYIIQRWNLTEKEAFLIEASLIDAFPGLTNLQRGHYFDTGVVNVRTLQKRFERSVYDEPKDFKYLIIKVKTQTLDSMLQIYPQTYRYEATRSAWRIKPKSITEYPFVFSATEGIVREIYRILEWYTVDDGTRVAFRGEIASETIRQRFVDKRLPDTYIKKGMASPVLFSKNTIG